MEQYMLKVSKERQVLAIEQNLPLTYIFIIRYKRICLTLPCWHVKSIKDRFSSPAGPFRLVGFYCLTLKSSATSQQTGPSAESTAQLRSGFLPSWVCMTTKVRTSVLADGASARRLLHVSPGSQWKQTVVSAWMGRINSDLRPRQEICF